MGLDRDLLCACRTYTHRRVVVMYTQVKSHFYPVTTRAYGCLNRYTEFVLNKHIGRRRVAFADGQRDTRGISSCHETIVP
ncbi:hypothetical protein RHRU231_450188 [Rhodococcus ruber]|uniref:Uncharacterized protein n=1 Tax=Rhodococcus ruber TaxID=1830 RepID=A0A098BMS5_9NOCA|nr:hypothetical protein RHRU231_450188 [Rhodococcus ruber]